MSTPKPRVSVVKSLDMDPPFGSDSLSEVNMDSSLFQSTSSILESPPPPQNNTVNTSKQTQKNESSAEPPKLSSSREWDYENYIEKPRGQVAEPRYVNPQVSPDYTARSFVMDQPQVSYTSLGISPPILGICAYFFGFLGGLVIMILEKKNLFVIFHAWQSMVIGVFAFVVQIVFVWSKSIYTLLWILYLIFEFFMVARVIIDSPSQRLFKLPIIGDWCEHQAFNRIQRHTTDFYQMP